MTEINTKPRLLWVDDEYSEFPDLILKLRRNGWDVDCAENLCEAREKIANNNFNRIILDMIIPFGSLPDGSHNSEAVNRKDYLGYSLLVDLEKISRWKRSKSIVILSVVQEDRLANRVKRMIDIGVVREQLVKKVGVTLDDILKAVELDKES